MDGPEPSLPMLTEDVDQAVDFRRLPPLVITSPDMELPMDPQVARDGPP